MLDPKTLRRLEFAALSRGSWTPLKSRVDQGKFRWAWLKGRLSLVPVNYELKPFESFLKVPEPS